MTASEADKLVGNVYDGIFEGTTKAEPGGQPLMPSASTHLALMKPGMAINPADFRNPWTPGNQNGSTDSAINTARLVDVIPKVNGIYTESGNMISQVYSQILDGVNIPIQQPDPVTEKQLADAHRYLYRTIKETDPDTGEVTDREIESVVYRKYLDNEGAFYAARLAYVTAYQAAQENEAQKKMWPLIAPTLQMPVRSAYNKWRSNFADKVEQNLAIMETSSQNALQQAFKKGKDLFNGYGVILEETGTGLAQPIQRTTLLPSNWYSQNSDANWITKDISSSNRTTSSSSEYVKAGGSAGFNAGIWSVSGNGGHSKESRHFSSETKNLRFKYEYSLVTIRRPWMIFSLLGTKGWNLGNLYPKGLVSNGSKKGQENTVWPLLPTGFVVVKGVEISADWSKTDWDLLKKETNAGASVGIGPFRIGGSYRKSTQKFNSSFDDAKGMIKVPGVQIIGFINQVVPYCPPATAPNT